MTSEPTTTSPSLDRMADVRADRRHLWILLLIILLGAVLRFAWLDRPALWGDECRTWQRTYGTFSDFLRENRDDGFVPLHYELYWAMGRLWTMTPWRMRVVPAIAGVLMIPAVYLLARQLSSRRSALAAAALTATSAYMLCYSRDAKMYMPAWLALTLHLGFLLWWLRCRSGVLWWSWVAAGTAAAGLHASTWLILLLDPIIYFTAGSKRPAEAGGDNGSSRAEKGRLIGWVQRMVRSRWWRGLGLLVLGLAIVAIGPLWFWLGYNQWSKVSGGLAPVSTAQGGNWGRSGLTWIDPHTRNKSGLELLRDSASAYLLGYSRAEEQLDSSGNVPIPAWVLHTAWSVMTVVCLAMIAGLVRWRTADGTEEQERWWRRTLWLSCWLVLPTYGFFYCRSVSSPASVGEVMAAGSFVGWHRYWIAPLAMGLAWLSAAHLRVRQSLVWTVAGAMAVLVVGAVVAGQEQWYRLLTEWMISPAILGILVACSIAVAWGNCGQTTFQRTRRLGGTLLVVGAVMAVCQLAWWGWTTLHEQAEAAGRGAQWRSIWMPRYLAVLWPALIIAVCLLLWRLPHAALRYGVLALLIAANLAQHIARLAADPEPRIDLIAADVIGGRQDSSLQVYLMEGRRGGGPGTGTFRGPVGWYYTGIELAKFTDGGKDVRNIHEAAYAPGLPPLSRLSSDMKRREHVRQLVVWVRANHHDVAADEIAAALGDEWVLLDRRQQQCWRHWNWQTTALLTRLNFERRPR